MLQKTTKWLATLLALVVVSAGSLQAASPAQAVTVATVDGQVMGLVVKVDPTKSEDLVLSKALEKVNQLAPQLTATVGEPIGLSWHAIDFGAVPDEALSQKLASAVKTVDGVENSDVNRYISGGIAAAGERTGISLPARQAVYIRQASAVRSLLAKNYPSATDPYTARIRLTWRAPAYSYSAKIVSYRILYSTDAKVYRTLRSSTGSTARSATISGVTPGQNYWFKVAAITKKSGKTKVGTYSARAWAKATAEVRPIINTSPEAQAPAPAPQPTQTSTPAPEPTQTLTPTPQPSPTNNVLVAVNDTYYLDNKLWHLNGSWGVRADTAWQITSGSPTVTVAIIDTGITNHQELTGQSWMNDDGSYYGRDFVSDSVSSNDSDGEDSNPYDSGDYRATNTCSSDASSSSSSWHGTNVASFIASRANDGHDLVGVAPTVKLLNVRALGACGGDRASLARSINWSAGVDLGGGTPVNQHPARVINLSIQTSSATVCDAPTQQAINNSLSANISVVVAAGNYGASGLKASQSYPGNCSGTIAVGATTADGDRASYSNRGPGVFISAPGGSGSGICPSTGFMIAASNSSSTVPNPSTSFYTCGAGTSYSSPVVAGIISLIYSVKPNITPTQVREILASTARSFAVGSVCAGLPTPATSGSGDTCGYGVVDAGAAVAAAQALP